MNADDTAQLIYLVLLLTVVASWVFIQNRQSLGRTAQQLAIWGLIFLGVIAGYGLWGDIKTTLIPQQSVISETGQIRVPRAADGHYYLTLDVNGAPVSFLVDTGASQIVLSHDDAERAGIALDGLAYLGRAMTANGEVRTARVTLPEVSLGSITDRNVRAWVNQAPMDKSLLGMTYLSNFSGIEIRGDELLLTR